MSALVLIHVLAVGAWIGCVMVEFIIERSRAGGEANRARAALLHYRTDLFVEVPLFSTVLVTGALLFEPSRFAGVYALKVLCGLGAVGINAFSVYPVVMRHRAAQAGNDAEVRRYARMIDRTVPVGGPLFLIALGAGAHLAGAV